jgi:hypothetical protein
MSLGITRWLSASRLNQSKKQAIRQYVTAAFGGDWRLGTAPVHNI